MKAGTTTNTVNRSTERLGMDVDGPDANGLEVGISALEEVADFGKITVWGHEAVAELDDAFIKGLGEWITFAEPVSE